MCTNRGIKKYLAIYVGLWSFALQMLGVMKKQNVRDLNLHKPRILTQKSNDILSVGAHLK
jgi:hypothetical protein